MQKAGSCMGNHQRVFPNCAPPFLFLPNALHPFTWTFSSLLLHLSHPLPPLPLSLQSSNHFSGDPIKHFHSADYMIPWSTTCDLSSAPITKCMKMKMIHCMLQHFFFNQIRVMGEPRPWDPETGHVNGCVLPWHTHLWNYQFIYKNMWCTNIPKGFLV